MDEVGVGDKWASKRLEVRFAAGDYAGSPVFRIAVMDHSAAMEPAAQRLVVERSDIARATGGNFDDMEIGQLQWR